MLEAKSSQKYRGAGGPPSSASPLRSVNGSSSVPAVLERYVLAVRLRRDLRADLQATRFSAFIASRNSVSSRHVETPDRTRERKDAVPPEPPATPSRQSDGATWALPRPCTDSQPSRFERRANISAKKTVRSGPPAPSGQRSYCSPTSCPFAQLATSSAGPAEHWSPPRGRAGQPSGKRRAPHSDISGWAASRSRRGTRARPIADPRNPLCQPEIGGSLRASH